MAKSDQGKKKPKSSGPMIDDDSVWVLGTDMTKFGRYPDHDAVDLASTSAIAALQDGGVTIHDMDVFAAGTLFQASSGMAQQVQTNRHTHSPLPVCSYQKHTAERLLFFHDTLCLSVL